MYSSKGEISRKTRSPPPYPTSTSFRSNVKLSSASNTLHHQRTNSVSPSDYSTSPMSAVEFSSPSEGSGDFGPKSNFFSIPPYPQSGRSDKCVRDVKCIEESIYSENHVVNSVSKKNYKVWEDTDRSCSYLYQSSSYSPGYDHNFANSNYNPLVSLQQQIDQEFPRNVQPSVEHFFQSPMEYQVR